MFETHTTPALVINGFEIDTDASDAVEGFEVSATTGLTAAEEYQGSDTEVSAFLSAFEV